jgi:hypothetical protein
MDDSVKKKPKMTLRDVTEDTKLYLDRERGQVFVQAMRDCGCDGPWLGTLKVVPAHLWTDEMKKHKRSQRFAAAIWAIYPVNKDGYGTRRTPVGWAYGRNNAARQLRSYIAQRRGG